MAGQVYAVASGKGGVGKTTTVVNLGVVLRRADHTVALVDGDLGMANLGTMLGIAGEATIHDVLAGEATVEEALVEEAPGFGVLPGSHDLSSYAGADPRELRGVIETLAESYDFVLVDTGAGMSHEDVLPLGLADRVILVTTPDPAAIGDTHKTADLADLAAGELAGLVVTMADESTDARYVASQVGVELLGVIPYDAAVRESTASATPLEGLNPDSPAAAAYRKLATGLAEGSAEPTTRAPAAESSEPAAEAAAAGGNEAAGSAQRDESAADEAADVADANEAAAADAAGEVAEAGEEPAEAGPTDTAESGEAADEPSAAAAEDATDDVDDYLEEFEDDEPASSGGLLAKLGRIFR